MNKIDFVIMWVDGEDPNWLKEKKKYSPQKIDDSNAKNRFRDWDILKYWFRGVEKYAPWVNNIYFVTWGHLPKWLNTEHSKLKIINHQDFIPKEYLPTFSSHTIELNLHRIEGLSERFVYFNDDLFIINPTKRDDYFKQDKPLNNFYETVNLPIITNPFSKICFNNVAILNNEFNKKKFYKDNLSKIFHLKNGFKNISQSLLLLPYPNFSGIGIIHGSSPMLKSNYCYLWDKYYDIFHNTCLHKFRNYDLDINQYVIKDYQTLTGNFYVRDHNFVKLINVESAEQLRTINKWLNSKKNKELCINDSFSESDNFNNTVHQIQKLFLKKFPDKCSFEK